MFALQSMKERFYRSSSAVQCTDCLQLQMPTAHSANSISPFLGQASILIHAFFLLQPGAGAQFAPSRNVSVLTTVHTRMHQTQPNAVNFAQGRRPRLPISAPNLSTSYYETVHETSKRQSTVNFFLVAFGVLLLLNLEIKHADFTVYYTKVQKLD